jgi:hypothetical protein
LPRKQHFLLHEIHHFGDKPLHLLLHYGRKKVDKKLWKKTSGSKSCLGNAFQVQPKKQYPLKIFNMNDNLHTAIQCTLWYYQLMTSNQKKKSLA